MANHHGRGDVMTKKYKSTCGGDSNSFCCSESALCACPIYCCTSCHIVSKCKFLIGPLSSRASILRASWPVRRRSWYCVVETSEDRPLWGRVVYTSPHGARLFSVPSGDRSVNPAGASGGAGLQRAKISMSAQKLSGSRKFASSRRIIRSASAVIPCRSSASKRRTNHSKNTRGQSRETY